MIKAFTREPTRKQSLRQLNAMIVVGLAGIVGSRLLEAIVNRNRGLFPPSDIFVVLCTACVIACVAVRVIDWWAEYSPLKDEVVSSDIKVLLGDLGIDAESQLNNSVLKEERIYLLRVRDAIGVAEKEIASQREENLRLVEALKDENFVYTATQAVRSRTEFQADRATKLLEMAVKQTIMFQNVGIGVIAFGLLIILCGAVLVFNGTIQMGQLAFVAPVSGAVFNVVGSGLIAFHKSASRTALNYYDRKQNLDNLLTGLELVSTKVMRESAPDVLPELVRALCIPGLKGEEIEKLTKPT